MSDLIDETANYVLDLASADNAMYHLLKDMSAYSIEMMDISHRSLILKENVQEMIPYMYGSIENIFYNSVWLVGVMGLFTLFVRRIPSNPFN